MRFSKDILEALAAEGKLDQSLATDLAAAQEMKEAQKAEEAQFAALQENRPDMSTEAGQNQIINEVNADQNRIMQQAAGEASDGFEESDRLSEQGANLALQYGQRMKQPSQDPFAAALSKMRKK